MYMAFEQMQVRIMVLRRAKSIPVSEAFLHCFSFLEEQGLSPALPWPSQCRMVRGTPPSDLISCLQLGRMVIPSLIVSHFLILLAPSESPNMKS